jgi:predicted Rossmann-fold nucleotide-binding protein
VFVDVAGYFAPMFEFIDASVAAGFVSDANAALARRASTVEHAMSLALLPADAYTPKWLA